MAASDAFGGMESFGYWCLQNSPRVSYRPSPSYHSLNPGELHPREQGPWLDKILESPTTLDPSECAAGLGLGTPAAQPGPPCLLGFPHAPTIIMPPPLDTINYPPLGSGEISRPEASQKVNAEEQGRKPSFRTLPYEVKTLIMQELDTKSPVSSRVEQNPETIVDKSGRIIGEDVTQDLKNASLVSKEWRSMAFRCLFRYIKWTPRIDQSHPCHRPPVRDIEHFLSTEKVLPMTQSMREIVEGLTVLAVHRPLSGFFEEQKARITYHGSRWERGRMIHMGVYEKRTGEEWWSFPAWVREFWAAIMKWIDPVRVTVVGTPYDAAYVLGASLQPAQVCSTMRRSLFEVRREKPQSWPQQHMRSSGWSVTYMLPWTHLLINEGDSPANENCLLLLSQCIYIQPRHVTHFTYINFNPAPMGVAEVIEHLVPASNIDLLIGPESFDSPLELCMMADERFMLQPNPSYIGGSVRPKHIMVSRKALLRARLATRGRVCATLASVLAAHEPHIYPFLRGVKRFRIRGRDDADLGERLSIQVSQLIDYNFTNSDSGSKRRWVVGRDGWLAKVDPSVEDVVMKDWF